MSEANGAHRPKLTKDSDFYQTPEIAIEALFHDNATKSIFEHSKSIHDPCCGNHAIANVCKKHDIVITESDIEYDGVDFLEDSETFDFIIANPPYSLKNKFIDHAISKAIVVGMILPYNVGNYNEFHDNYLDIPEFMFKLKMTPKFFMTKDYQYNLEKRGGVSSYAWYFWSKFNNSPNSEERYINLDKLRLKIEEGKNGY